MDAYEIQLVRETMRLVAEAYEDLKDGLLHAVENHLVDAMAQLENLAS